MWSGIEAATERGMKLKRLTENFKEYAARFPDGYFGDAKGYPIKSGIVYERLGFYEDLADAGKLAILPCGIGSMVYMIYRFLDEGAWDIEEHKIRLEDLEHIGETVFLTREEAEADISEKKKEDKG